MSDDLSGRTLGRYRVLERLGRGGMAEVYRAYQPSLDRYVAIKVIYPHLAADPRLQERFGREARAVAALHHPNIVQVHDFDMQDNKAFMAMEFIGGPTLKAAITSLGRRGRLLPLPVVGQIVGQLADALAYAHEQRVIHRDVKPANVLLRRQLRAPAGRVAGEQPGAHMPPPLTDDELDELLLSLRPGSAVLTDFGVARVLSESVEQTAAGTILGSPAYMAPEQGRGDRVGPASDIYSLGVVLYELITGRVPFDADTPFAILIKHTQAPLPPPRGFRPDLPEALERVLFKALAKDPAERFLDAGAFGAAVREACGAPTAGLRLDAAPARGAGAPAGPSSAIDELQAMAPPAAVAPPAATPAAPVAPPAATPPAPSPPRGGSRWPLGVALALLAVALLAGLAYLARGALVGDGGQAVGATTPAAAPQGATTAPPAAVADALAAASEACGAPECPGGSASQAIATLDAAIAAAPESAPLYAARAQTYIWWDPYSYAEQVRADVEAALQRDPAHGPAYLARGMLQAIHAEDDAGIATALEDLGRAIELDPTLIAAYLARAEIFSSAPDYYEDVSPSRDQVIADASAALELEPELAHALVLRGNAYANSDEPDLAYADYSAALEHDPANLEALMGRAGISRYSREDYEAALADYDILLDAYPDYSDGRRARASLLAEQGEYEAARPDADVLVELQPAEPWIYLYRGQLLLAAGNLDGALDDFEQALLIAGSDYLPARYGRGVVRLEQGDAAAAVGDLEAAAADFDNLDIEWYTFFQGRRRIFLDLARAYMELGRPAETADALEQAIEVDGDWYMPYLVRGQARAAIGDPAGAREDLRAALERAETAEERAAVEEELRRLP